eukprot:3413020-Amphidinium_carterae.1
MCIAVKDELGQHILNALTATHVRGLSSWIAGVASSAGVKPCFGKQNRGICMRGQSALETTCL